MGRLTGMDKPGKAILLFDGHCHLCHGWVRFVLERKKGDNFDFEPLQSDKGKALLQAHGLDAQWLNSLVLIDGERVLLRSDGALGVFDRLGGGWRLLAAVARVFPLWLRDWVYNGVAKVRYRIFGRSEVCLLPTRSKRAG